MGPGGKRRPGPAGISSQELVSLLRKANISGVILMGPESLTESAERENSGYVYSFAEVPRDRESRHLLWNEQTLQYMKRRLERGIRGIGEISLRHFQPPGVPDNSYPADGPYMLRLYDLAARYRVPVSVHVERDYRSELEQALAHNRSTIIIWAHMGDADPALVGEMMGRNPNLYADISCRNPYFQRAFTLETQSLADAGGRLKPEWRVLFEKFPDRFLFGLDLGSGGRHTMLDLLAPFYRSVLGQLSPRTAEQIGFRNARRLLRLDEAATQ
jgi:predicted TIM-barrel fold metal-dependent hydrolase